MADIEILLKEHPFLSELSMEHIQKLATCSITEKFSPGEYIFREGEEAASMYLVRHGKVAVEEFAAQKGALTIQTVGEGEVLGWSWLVPPHKYRFSARAMELSRTIKIDGVTLYSMCEEDHELGYQILHRFFQVVVDRLEATRLQIMDVYGVNP